MKFVNPSFLFALFALAIPVIIHLFNFRKFKKVYFTNVRFLKDVKQETQSKSKLRHLLVLACRLLAIAFLVSAFAQPYIPVSEATIIGGDRAVSIFIDNSFSMDAINKSGRLLDEAKNKAKEIAAAYKPSDRFQLLTNDFEGRHQKLLNREAFIEFLDDIQLSPKVKTLSQVLSRQTDVLNGASDETRVKTSFILSDFQKSISDFSKIKNDTSIRVKLIPTLAQNNNNLYVDSCWFTSPVRKINQTERLYVRIKNTSDKAYENIPIKLFINGQQKTPASFSIEANATVDTVLTFTVRDAGIQNGKVEISDYPITFDDRFYFSFEVVKQIPVLSINASDNAAETGENAFINALFGHDSTFVLANSPENKLDYSALPNKRMVILNELKSISSGLAQELKRFLEAGGSLLLFPSSEADLVSYSEFLKSVHINVYERLDTLNTKVDRINFDHEIYQDIFEKKPDNLDLPVINSHYKIGKSVKSNEEYLLRLQNGDLFLGKYSYGKGKVYLSAVPLNVAFSNFAKHALFVPTLYQIALFSQQQNKLFYTIGKDEIIELQKTSLQGENVFRIAAENNQFDVIPEHQVVEAKTNLYVHGQIAQPGNYFLYGGKERITGLSFNYDRKESDLSTHSPDELVNLYESAGFSNFSLIESATDNLTQTLSELDQGKKLWKLCIILVLVFLAAETLLLRFWK